MRKRSGGRAPRPPAREGALPRLTVLHNLQLRVRDFHGRPLLSRCHVGYAAGRRGEGARELILRVLARLATREPGLALAGRLAQALERALRGAPVGVVIESRWPGGPSGSSPAVISTALRGPLKAHRAEFLSIVWPASSVQLSAER